MTALHQACLFNHSHIISLLLRRGADVCARRSEDSTSFSLLLRNDKFNDSEKKNSIIAIVKEYAKITFDNSLFWNTDMTLMLNHQNIYQYLIDCNEELSQMSNTKFYASHSYYSVLKMSYDIKKLKNLTRNEDFVKRF